MYVPPPVIQRNAIYISVIISPGLTPALHYTIRLQISTSHATGLNALATIQPQKRWAIQSLGSLRYVQAVRAMLLPLHSRRRSRCRPRWRNSDAPRKVITPSRGRRRWSAQMAILLGFPICNHLVLYWNTLTARLNWKEMNTSWDFLPQSKSWTKKA